MVTRDIASNRARLLDLQRRLDDERPRGGGAAELRERLRELQRRAAAESASPRQEPSPGYEPVAIVGMHGMLPGADTIQEFWERLEQGEPCISEVPRDRFDWREYYDPTDRDTDRMRTRWGGFLSDISSFDHEFFSIVAREAELIDPQQRLLLTSVYRAIEDAGYASDTLKGRRIGVYVGVEDNEFLQYLRDERIDLGMNGFNHHPSMIANRISHYFDFRGPSEIVNTMCSAAAVALHKACSAIRSLEIEMAVVGAARVILRAEPMILLSRMKVLSPVDTVKSFGEGADGYVRAEGVGSVVLKSLGRAEADGDHIYAIIRSSAINFNGQGGMSIAAPNREAHAEVIKECYERARVDPGDVEYIEAQGMGNQVGDIAEWEAINRALERLSRARGKAPVPGACRVSTAKPLIGHMECMSALGALFKIIGSMTNNRLYGIHGLNHVNPYLDTRDRPCRLLRRSEGWSPRDRPRLAGLHSYGSGGNNAHLLIEEHVPAGSPAHPPAARADARDHLFVFSAPDEDRLREGLRRFVEHVERNPRLATGDVAHTLLVGRRRFARRVAIVASSLRRLVTMIEAYLRDGGSNEVLDGGAGEPPSSLARVAERWIAGESVDAAQIGVVGAARRVSLPGYPFRRNRCWPDPVPADAAAREAEASPEPSIAGALTRILADMLRIAPTAVEPNKGFTEYGFDSITLVGFGARIAETYPSLSLPATTFLEYPTVEVLAEYLARKLDGEAPAPGPVVGRGQRGDGAPERLENPGDLQLLNDASGVPVFWFHGALGTVQSFIPLARRIGKDVRFYGVQSRAVRTDVDPPEDLMVLARSYADLLIDANGQLSFHLGGYSQGGALAVEVARVLRRLGREVKSVVMIDTPFPPIGSVFSVQLNCALAFANILQINGRKVSDAIPKLLRRIEGRNAYWEEFLRYGVDEGVSNSTDELGRILRKLHKITRANVRSMETHVVEPLGPSGDTEYHLFQRRSPGGFFSDALCTLEEARRHNHYFAANDCAGKWQKTIPALRRHPTDAADHFSILEEEASLAEICRTCRGMYAPEPGGAFSGARGDQP